MLKKHGFKFLIAVMVLQLLVPAAMIANAAVTDYRTEKYGVEYKFKVEYLWIYDDWLYYTLTEYDNEYFDRKAYSAITVDSDGFAKVTWSDEKPVGRSYIENEGYWYDFPNTRLDKNTLKIPDDAVMTKKSTPPSHIYNNRELYYADAYIEVYVYNGRVTVKDLYIDSTPIKEFFESFNEAEGDIV